MDSIFALKQRFRKVLCDECGVPKGCRLLVAVSGGSDSVALLRLLHQVAAPLALELEVAHLDHGLRDESVDDAAFVAALAASCGLPLHREKVSISALAAAAKRGREETARNVRRAFLLRCAAERGCDLVALGHQRGDQAETVLHRLIRGSGATGLAAMRHREGQIIRPLLGFSRDELLLYLERLGQGYREDASNSDPSYTRNRIRHELLPLLNRFNPQIEGQLASLARRLATEEDYWREAGETAWPTLQPRWEEARLTLSRDALLAQHPALRMRLLRRALVAAGIDGEIGQVHLTGLESLLQGPRPQGEVYLPAGWVGRRYDELVLSAVPPLPAIAWSLLIAGPGDYQLPGDRRLRVSLLDRALGERVSRVEFAAAEVVFPLTLRTPRPGDRLRLGGMTGRKKLKDYFIAERLPREARQRQLLLEGEELLWVVSRRRCSGFQPRPGSPVLAFELL